MAVTSDAGLLRKMALVTRRASTTGATKVKAARARAFAAGKGRGKGGAEKATEAVRGSKAAGSSRGNAREGLLATILERRGAMSQRDLAAAAGSKPSAMSEALAKLEADGYVVREVDPADHRAFLVRLTEQGAKRAVEVGREREAMLARVMGCLTDDERAQLDCILDKLLANLDAGAGDKT